MGLRGCLADTIGFLTGTLPFSPSAHPVPLIVLLSGRLGSRHKGPSVPGETGAPFQHAEVFETCLARDPHCGCVDEARQKTRRGIRDIMMKQTLNPNLETIEATKS